jgi:hypothetical protein
MRELLQPLYQSFYSSSLYVRAAQEWRGLGFSFLFVFAFLMTVFFAFSMGELRTMVAKLPEAAAQLPELTYKDGKMSIKEPVPYYIRLSEDPPMLIAVDTRYADTGLDKLFDWMQQNNIHALLTSTKLIFLKENNSGMEIHDLRTLGEDFTVTKADWENILSTIGSWVMPVIVIMVLLGLYLVLILSALLWGVIGLLISQIFRANLEFTALVRIASLSSVPVWVLGGLLAMIGLGGLLPAIFLRISYLAFASRANR